MIRADASPVVDIHNHLVPGVDDGVRDLPELFQAADLLAAAGIQAVVTTPHIDGSLTHDRRGLADRLGRVDDAWGMAAAALAGRGGLMRFERGHEVMMDVPDPDLSDPRIRMAGTPFVLIEWPRLTLPPSTVPVIERIVRSGYRPIVAHPERYREVGHSLGIVAGWRAAGALLQVNYGSLSGRYGSEARRAALLLLRRGWVDYLATDLHGPRGGGIQLDEARRVLERMGGREAFDILTCVNPARLLEAGDPLPVPPLEDHDGAWARIRGLFSDLGGR